MSITLFFLFILLLAIQAYFAVRYFIPLLRHVHSTQVSTKGVSVIICAKNEATNLKNNLGCILNQEYPDFEVIVLNDHSEDNTAEVMAGFSKNYKNLIHINASESIKSKSGKKWALSEAISKASHDVVLLTDADCRPNSENWIREMVSGINSKNEIVLGIGQYERTGRWYDALVQYETFITALTYLGMAKSGEPYMGVGRNLAYKTSVFSHSLMTKNVLASGDDDLFIQEVARADNTALCVNNEAHTISPAPQSYSKWLKQKVRHYSTATSYNLKVKSILMLLKASFYLPNYIFIILLVLNYQTDLLIFMFLSRWMIWLSLIQMIKKKLAFSQPFYFLPCFEIYFSLLDIYLTVKSLKKNKIEWE